jgi:FkbM family methyltransferase
MDRTKLIISLGNIPLINTFLRRVARCYSNGSVATIKNGHLSGFRWMRNHRYVSGFWLGIYEMPIQECLIRELRHGSVFYDVGANAGFFSLLGSRCVGKNGHVYSFEPLPENIAEIQRQFSINHIDNCTIVDAAVSDHEGMIDFVQAQNTFMGHVLHERGAEKGNVIKIRSMTLNEFSSKAMSPDFIKMDIEGGEISALMGARSLLGSKNPPRILIEFHSDSLMKEGRALLENHGYKLHTLTGELIVSFHITRYVLAIPESV